MVHVAHFICRLSTGGLENGLVNLVNRLPSDRFRHSVICLTHATGFSSRLVRSDVPIFELHEHHGMSLTAYLKLWRLLRRLQPDILHTRNIPTLEGALCAFAAGVPARIHGEHGRDVESVGRMPFKYRVWRTIIHPFVTAYTAVSDYGASSITEVTPSVPVTRIYNGVDTECFRPATLEKSRTHAPFQQDDIVIGTVTRLEPIKNPLLLVNAFALVLQLDPQLRIRLRLAIVGDGSLASALSESVRALGLQDITWLAGDRSDVPDLLRDMDIFVLSSRTEGLSNTILEAMATGLPVIATNVGGNSELVDSNSGILVPSDSPRQLANAILSYVNSPTVRARYGQTGRQHVERKFSLHVMVNEYAALYESTIHARRRASPFPL